MFRFLSTPLETIRRRDVLKVAEGLILNIQESDDSPMKDIDLYEFKETLKDFEDEKFLDFAEDKGVAVLEVGKTSREIDNKLIALGYKKGERVLVVVQ